MSDDIAEVVTEWPAGGRYIGKYDRYLDGQIWKLRYADFGHKTKNGMQATIASIARRYQLRVRCRTVGEYLYLQATPIDKEPKA